MPQNFCPKRVRPDDIHSAVENENTVPAYFTSKQKLPLVLQRYTIACAPAIEHRVCRCLSCVTALLIEQGNIHASHLDGP